MKERVLIIVTMLLFVSAFSAVNQADYTMLGKQYRVVITNEGFYQVEAEDVEYIELNRFEAYTFRQELITIKELYMQSYYHRNLYDGLSFRDVISPKIIKYCDCIYPFTCQTLVPWVSANTSSAMGYILTIRAYKSVGDSYNYEPEKQGKTSTHVFSFASEDELISLIEALEIEYEVQMEPRNYIAFRQINIGAGLCVNRRTMGAEFILSKCYLDAMKGYESSPSDFKDYLDINFVNTWGDYVEKTNTILEGVVNIGLFSQKKALIYKAGLGMGFEQEYLLINEGEISIYPGGHYSIAGKSSVFPNINLGLGFKLPEPSPIYIMLNNNINSKYSEMGFSVGCGF